MEDSPQSSWSVPRWQRELLPGALIVPSRAERSLRDWAVDIVLLAAAGGLGAFLLVDTWDHHDGVAAALDVAAGVLAWLALWLRRQHPAAVGIGSALVALASATAGGPALLAAFNAAIRASTRAVAAVAALGVAGSVSMQLLYPSGDPFVLQLVLGVAITALVVGWGLFVRARRALVRSLVDRAERLEIEQRLRIEQAREAERRRIAREMHDVLAHRVSLLSVHAGALEFRPDAPPEEIAAAAAVVRTSAQAAMQELRQVVGVLRADEPEGAPEPPQPTMAQIPGLIEESRAAGMSVEERLEVRADGVPSGIGRTVYRVVQEGLTNARKHAPAAAVAVSLHADDESRIVVEVVNRRPLGPLASSLSGGGTGLVGLAERVALAGGQLEHGPRADGAFVLRATLPCNP